MSDIQLRSRQVRCKKPHRCDWCGERLTPGEVAAYDCGISDKEFYTRYLHLECQAALNNSDIDADDGYELMAYRRGKTAAAT